MTADGGPMPAILDPENDIKDYQSKIGVKRRRDDLEEGLLIADEPGRKI